MYCGDTCITRGNIDRREAVSLMCRAWTCPDCSPKRKRVLIAQAVRGQPNTLLTLTTRWSADADPIERCKSLARAWRCLRKIIMRKHQLKRLPFLAVVERTKLGAPHLHILLRSPWLHQAMLSREMARLHDSPNVDIRRIDNPGRCAGYVAKYIGKEPQKFGTCKRYWQSRDYQQTPPKQPGDTSWLEGKWEREPGSLTRWVRNWHTLGYQAEFVSDHRARAWRAGCPP